MHRKILKLFCVAFFCQAAACTGAEHSGMFDSHEPALKPTQGDPTHDAFGHYHFEINSNPLFDLLIIGPEDVDNFDADTEYWYVHSSALVDLGEEDIQITLTSGNEDPPSLSGDQEFTQPVYLTWQSFETDPVSVGELYQGPNEDIFLRFKAESGEITRIVWYQVIADERPFNLAPTGTFTPLAGSVTVPKDKFGYYIDATIE